MKRRLLSYLRFHLVLMILASLGVLVGAYTLLGRPRPVQATSNYLAAARLQYPTIIGTALDSCNLCHLSGSNDKNQYGDAYESHGHSFSAIELLDSDHDGYNNLTEINAHTFPGDAASHPNGATATPTATGALTATPTPVVGTPTPTPTVGPVPPGVYKIIGWNDLGMHCMNESFANLAVLPPFNTLWAQVVRQGPQPTIVTSGVTVEYSILDNTYSAGKTDFWQYAQALFGVNLPPNVGLTGSTLAGVMHAVGDHFKVEGIPLTPYRDSAPTTWYPYQLAHLVARDSTTGQVLAQTITVAPVSTEMRCDTCHADGMQGGIGTGSVETNILTLHDQEEGTSLMNHRPVLCANCHGSNALGLPGNPDLPNLSRAMHHRHTPGNAPMGTDTSLDTGAVQALARFARGEPAPVALAALNPNDGTNDCYLCHPGQQTQCLRDVMYSQGLRCMDCHGGTAQVANPTRRPWIDEPKCGACHGPTYAENSNTLYRNSTGHGGLYCESCHGSPHAILPSTQANDNIQNIALQGHAGTLSDCRVCHAQTPPGRGPHGIIQRPAVCAPVDLLRDPGFEISPPNPYWQTSSNVGSAILTGNSQPAPHRGSWMARLGGADNVQESLWHTMTVSSGISGLRVSYWWRVDSTDLAPAADTLAVQVRAANGVVLQTLETLSNQNAGAAWTKSTVTLTQPYAGQTIQLAFVAHTNGSNPTTFYVDDADIMKVCLSGLSGDVTGDCQVTVTDVQDTAAHWTVTQDGACFASPYDLEPDGQIDVIDIMRVAAQWQ